MLHLCVFVMNNIDQKQLVQKFKDTSKPGGRGVLQISSDRDDRRIFLGSNFFDGLI